MCGMCAWVSENMLCVCVCVWGGGGGGGGQRLTIVFDICTKYFQ